MPTDEQITDQQPEAFDREKFYDEWKSGKKPLVDAIMSNYTKPKPQLTPEEQQKAKFGSALTDTFSSMAEMFAHGKGAMIRNREGASNQQTTNAKLQAYQDKYDQEMQHYNGTKANAELQDFNHKLEIDRLNSSEKRQYYINKQKQEEKAAALARQLANDKSNSEFKDRTITNQENAQKNAQQNHKDTLAMEREHLGIERERLNQDKKNKFSGLVINAHPQDNNAETDSSGRKVVSIPMNKEQIQGMANSAKNDADFMKRHPELLIDKPDMFGTPHKGLTKDDEIAWTYAQEQYNKRFAKPQQAKPTTSVPQWKIPVGSKSKTNDPLGLGL